MDHFVDGVWADLALTDEEAAAHRRRVEPARGPDRGRHHRARAARRARAGSRTSARDGGLPGLPALHGRPLRRDDARTSTSRSSAGPATSTDPTIAGIRRVANERRRLVVMTLGVHASVTRHRRTRRPRAAPSRSPRCPSSGPRSAAATRSSPASWRAITTNRTSRRRSPPAPRPGRMVTAWDRPLPDEAYGPGVEALRRPAGRGIASGSGTRRRRARRRAMAISPARRAWRRRISIATDAPVVPVSREPPRHAA